jgi:hypothetical protein
MAQRKRYYYDEETCSFKEEQVTTGERIKQGLIISGISLALSSLMVTGYFLFSSGDPRVIELTAKNNLLDNRFKSVQTELATLKDAVNVIYTDHNQLRAQFAAPAITHEIWDGGVGGAVIDPTNPEILNKTQHEIVLSNLQQKTICSTIASNQFKPS